MNHPKFIVLLFLVITFCFSSKFLVGQVSSGEDKILLLGLKSHKDEIVKYKFVKLGKHVKCIVKGDSIESRYKLVKGNLSDVDSTFMIVDSTKVCFDKCIILNTWTTGKRILKLAVAPVVLAGGYVTGLTCSLMSNPIGIVIVPVCVAIGFTCLVLPAHTYKLSMWQCSPSTKSQMKIKKREVRKKVMKKKMFYKK